MADNFTFKDASAATQTADSRDVGSGVQRQRVEVSGIQPAAGTGTITTTSSVAPTSGMAVTGFGNCTITVSGTYAGVTFVFEFSDDSGTTWFPLQAAKHNGVPVVGDTPGTNATASYDAELLGATHVRVRATAWTSGSASVRITPGGITALPVVAVSNVRGATPTQITVTAANADTAILAANPSRIGFRLYNNSTAVLNLLYGSGTASSTNFTAKIPAGGTWIEDSYTGAVRGWWTAANGNVLGSEIGP